MFKPKTKKIYKQKKSGLDRLREILELEKPLEGPPPLGMRIIKSGLAMFVISIIYFLWDNRPNNAALLALIAGLVSMQDTVGSALRIGLIRVIATALGGILGIGSAVLITMFKIKNNMILFALCLSIGTMICIMMCVWLNMKEGSIIATVVFMGILIDIGIDDSIWYAVNRTFDTAIGIGISFAINILIRRPPATTKELEEQEKKESEKDSFQ